MEHAVNSKLEPLTETAFALGLPPSWLKEYVRLGKIPCVRLNGSLWFNVDAVRTAVLGVAEQTLDGLSPRVELWHVTRLRDEMGREIAAKILAEVERRRFPSFVVGSKLAVHPLVVSRWWSRKVAAMYGGGGQFTTPWGGSP